MGFKEDKNQVQVVFTGPGPGPGLCPPAVICVGVSFQASGDDEEPSGSI